MRRMSHTTAWMLTLALACASCGEPPDGTGLGPSDSAVETPGPAPALQDAVGNDGSGSGQVSWPDYTELGQCPPDLEERLQSDPRGIDVATLSDYVDSPDDWILLSFDDLETIETNDVDPATLEGLELMRFDLSDEPLGWLNLPERYGLRGTGPFSAFLMQTVLADKMLAELGRGARVLIGTRNDGSGDVVASLRPDGSAGFLNSCGRLWTRWLDQLATTVGMTAADLLLSLASDPSGSPTADLFESFRTAPVPWEQQSPDERILDPEETPQQVLDDLVVVVLRFDLPADWADFEGRICSRASLGWNECVILGLSGTEVESTPYAVPGEPLEIWLDDAGQPVGLMLSIPWELLSQAEEQDAAILIEGTGMEFVDTDALWEAVRDGSAPIITARIAD